MQKNIKPISGRKMVNKKFPLKQSMNLSKLQKILKKNNFLLLVLK